MVHNFPFHLMTLDENTVQVYESYQFWIGTWHIFIGEAMEVLCRVSLPLDPGVHQAHQSYHRTAQNLSNGSYDSLLSHMGGGQPGGSLQPLHATISFTNTNIPSHVMTAYFSDRAYGHRNFGWYRTLVRVLQCAFEAIVDHPFIPLKPWTKRSLRLKQNLKAFYN